MVTLECLDSLDHLQWLRTGARAAEVLQCNQSTISRDARKCQEVFGVRLVKRASEWEVEGGTSLLEAERLLHQRYRWEMRLPLRLDAQHWLRESYEPLNLQGWVKGNFNYLEYHRPLELLRQRILDAWLCSAPDHPVEAGLSVIRLCSMPSWLMVNGRHPLVAMGASVTLEDVRRYPLLPLPDQSFPVFQGLLADLGLTAARPEPEAAAETSLPLEDLLVGIASPLTAHLYGPEWVPLPLRLPITVGDVLVVRSEFAAHPRTRSLVEALIQRLHGLCSDLPEVEIHTAAVPVPG